MPFVSHPGILNVYDRIGIDFVDGNKVYLYDKNRNAYLDFISGLGVNILGYNDRELSKIFNDVRIIHLSNLYSIEPYNSLAHIITENTGFDSVFMANSGAEAVECALKIMLHYYFSKTDKSAEKPEIIVVSGSFHGRTIATSSISEHGRHQGIYSAISPFVVRFVEKDDIEGLKSSFNEKTLGVILEPILGQGGVFKLSKDFLQVARKMCSMADLPLCFDCIQCGLGRSGFLFAHNEFGVVPDICVIGKALGVGLPSGACLSLSKFTRFIESAKDHGSTFGGNPLVCSVAKYALTRLLDKDKSSLLNNITAQSNYIKFRLLELKNRFSYYIKDIRVYGLMIAISLTSSLKNTQTTLDLALKYRLLVANAAENSIRMLPPYIIQKQDVDLFIEKLFGFFREQ